MNKALAVSVIACLLVSACVTSESTGRTPPPTTNEDAADRNYELGASYYRNGNYELARDRLERATELNPRHANAYSMLALTLVQLGNERLATEAFQRAVRIAPNSFDVRNAYAIFLCGENRFDEALEQFDRAIRVRENDNREIMLTNAGVCIAKKPDLERAEQYFREALEERGTYGAALIQMAALKHGNGEHLTARAFLQRYLASNEPSPAVLNLAIQIETALGDDRAATDYSNDLLRDFPNSQEAQVLLRSGN